MSSTEKLSTQEALSRATKLVRDLDPAAGRRDAAFTSAETAEEALRFWRTKASSQAGFNALKRSLWSIVLGSAAIVPTPLLFAVAGNLDEATALGMTAAVILVLSAPVFFAAQHLIYFHNARDFEHDFDQET